MLLNTKKDGELLFEIEFIPKGDTKIVFLGVYANNRLDVSNYLIRNKIFGNQLSISHHRSNLMK